MTNGTTTMISRLDLPRIVTALDETYAAVKARPRRWQTLEREPLSREILWRLADGYRYVDRVLPEDIDVFTNETSEHLLELNHLVLCGRAQENRDAAAIHVEATRKFFFAERKGGISDLIKWYDRNRDSSPEALAAGCFMRIVSEPQLFIEGNQRTAALICSYILARHGLPPLVPTAKNCWNFFRVAADVKALDRGNLLGGFRFWRVERRLAKFRRRYADSHFLVSTSNAEAESASPA